MLRADGSITDFWLDASMCLLGTQATTVFRLDASLFHTIHRSKAVAELFGAVCLVFAYSECIHLHTSTVWQSRGAEVSKEHKI